MADFLEQLVQKVKTELINITKESEDLTEDNAQSFYEWMKVEYVNYMQLSKRLNLVTLYRLEERYKEYTPLINILKRNIDAYGSMQAYYRVSLDLLK